MTRDLFGCIDILSIGNARNGCDGIQTTTRPNAAKRLHKAMALPALRTWVEVGNRFFVFGWAKVGPRGKPKSWKPRIVEVVLLFGKLVAVQAEGVLTPNCQHADFS